MRGVVAAMPWMWRPVLLALLACLFFLAGCASLSTGDSPDSGITPSSVPGVVVQNGEDPQDAAGPAAATAPSPMSLPSQPPSTAASSSLTSTIALPATSDCGCTPTVRPPFDPASWKTLPVVPPLNDHAREILAAGRARGNNPRAFSKIGDCESRTTWFLGSFDLGEEHYNLGPYEEDLSPVVEYYAGSFNRLSQAANPGFTAASLLSPLRADPKVCEKAENPLACEYRQHQPAVAFIMLGTNDAVNPKTFEGHLRKIIEYTLEQDILPILGTKADNIEGDHQINQTIARLAVEYDLPLWNYWLAVQELPGRGLQEDGAHLTYAGPFFNNPVVLKRGWPVRNLNALQILKETMQDVDIP